jgi:NTP pyrophosphatase (non-canonical NTP hydrolase)
MNSNEYQKDVLVTDLQDYDPVKSRLTDIKAIRLLHAAMGIGTEAGEFMDVIKKHILYGKEIDTINLKEEIGDLFWYIALACDELNVSFDYIFEQNIAKLRQRYSGRFTENAALNRDLEKERSVLEKPNVD